MSKKFVHGKTAITASECGNEIDPHREVRATNDNPFDATEADDDARSRKQARRKSLEPQLVYYIDGRLAHYLDERLRLTYIFRGGKYGPLGTALTKQVKP